MSAFISLEVPQSVDPDRLAAAVSDLIGEPCTAVRTGSGVEVRSESNQLVKRRDEVEEMIRSHRSEASTEFARLESKARRVWRGEDTFTVAQIQKIVAGLVLRELG